MTGAAEETWADLPGYSQRVSSLGVVVGPSGKVLVPFIRPSGAIIYSLKGPAGRKAATLDWIMEQAGFWNPDRRHHDVPWTAAEDAVLRLAKGRAEAVARLPGRSIWAIKERRKRLGIRWAKVGGRRLTNPSPQVWGRDLYDRVRAACPKGLPPDVRDDLVQDVAVLVMEGFTGQLRDAYRLAQRARNRVFGSWYEVSAHRTMGSTGRTYLDSFAAGSSL